MRLLCEKDRKKPKELQLKKYLQMTLLYEGLNRDITCDTRYKRPLKKRTSEESLQLS